ncbi:hypothetical protein NERG_00521 [Nematocida ausubeli]|uniref:Signal peptidase complex catalytic subunit SEC11 n=1 Tax=Nematocida ausubeli (strain ATCC PRA-371 / ERTm2) TaxID=1913371 RepID=H8ZAA0_NEMA1|nr:hypothetical protein NERG_00521 [Nematocida ausubeli]
MRAGDILRLVPMAELVFCNEDFEYYNEITFRELCTQALQAIYLLTSAYMVWIAVSIICNTKAPIVVVLSESMYPGFDRGDILFLANVRNNYYAGDICVFELAKDEIPIVHRVIDKRYSIKEVVPKTENKKDPVLNHLQYMTKGDNNYSNDIFLYREKNINLINTSHMRNIVYASFPLLGMVTIWAGYWKWVKYAVIGILAMDVMFTRDNTLKIARFNEAQGKEEEKEEAKKKKEKTQ